MGFCLDHLDRMGQPRLRLGLSILPAAAGPTHKSATPWRGLNHITARPSRARSAHVRLASVWRTAGSSAATVSHLPAPIRPRSWSSSTNPQATPGRTTIDSLLLSGPGASLTKAMPLSGQGPPNPSGARTAVAPRGGMGLDVGAASGATHQTGKSCWRPGHGTCTRRRKRAGDDHGRDRLPALHLLYQRGLARA